MSEEKWLDKFDLSEEEKKSLKEQLKADPSIRPKLIMSLTRKLKQDDDKKEALRRKKVFRNTLIILSLIFILFYLFLLMMKYQQNVIEQPKLIKTILLYGVLPVSAFIGLLVGIRAWKNGNGSLIVNVFGCILLSVAFLMGIPMFAMNNLARAIADDSWEANTRIIESRVYEKRILSRKSRSCKREITVSGVRNGFNNGTETGLCLDLLSYPNDLELYDEVKLVGRKSSLGVVIDKIEKLDD
ncbi:MAG: hypothetical protein HWE16_12585 [Gammaproteobacteria bacterium]|nr:hypothetical protein [Gammaproteobacteria bacterium]